MAIRKGPGAVPGRNAMMARMRSGGASKSGGGGVLHSGPPDEDLYVMPDYYSEETEDEKDKEIERLRVEVLIAKGICQSKAEARRIIKQGAYEHAINKH